jgi:hypothetical protein
MLLKSGKKNPRTQPMRLNPGMPFFILDVLPKHPIHEVQRNFFCSGLPASGSFYLPRLPIRSDSGNLRFSSPVTAAGPRRISTVFPIEFSE